MQIEVVVEHIHQEDDAWDQDHRGCLQEHEDSSLKQENPHGVFS